MAVKNTDRWLLALWRKAVLARWGNECIFCGNNNTDELEAHHIIPKRHRITRYDVRNGVPVCKPSVRECHRRAKTLEGIMRIKDILDERGDGDWHWLRLMEHVRYTDFLRREGYTDKQMRDIEKHALKRTIKEAL